MDATSAFKTVLQKLGYTDIKIEEAKLPKHIIEWARGDDEELTDEETAEVLPYFEVTSVQGSFGIVMGPYILLDLKGTGYTAKDFGDTETPESHPLISLNNLTLKRLKQLLGTKKN